MSTKMFVADSKSWQDHYSDMAGGGMNNGNHFHRLKSTQKPVHTTPEVKVVSDTKDLVNKAEALLKEQEEGYKEVSKKRGFRKPPSKRNKSILLKDSPSDIFTE